MHHLRLFCLILVIVAVSNSTSADDKPTYFSAKPGALVLVKQRIAKDDKNLARALKKLVGDADTLLRESPPSVMDKQITGPSGDKHDYMSLAPYFWPDPNKSDGLPYIRKDGQTNPESRDKKFNDSPRIGHIGNAIETLCLAYYFTGKEAYAAHAAKYAHVWFLDEATHMNPNMKYAQAVRGVNDGRGIGILEGRHISVAADALQLIRNSPSWPAADQTKFHEWLDAFLNWMLTSEAGKDEHAAKNNHGSWFDVQTARLALCTGKMDVARRIIEEAKERRIKLQIEPDGKQPLELKRTNSLTYSRFNIDALTELATLGEHANVDLWNYKTSDGRCIRVALDFLLPYVDSPAKPWPFEQIKE